MDDRAADDLASDHPLVSHSPVWAILAKSLGVSLGFVFASLGLPLLAVLFEPSGPIWLGLALALTPWGCAAYCVWAWRQFSSGVLRGSRPMALLSVITSSVCAAIALSGLLGGRNTFVSGYFDVFGSTPIIVIAIALLLGVYGIEFVRAKTFSTLQLFSYVAAMALTWYVIGVIIWIDQRMDSELPRHLETYVTGKLVERGGRGGPVLSVQFAAVGGVAPQTGFSMTAAQFNQTQYGQPICVDLHPGALGIPWFSQGKDCR